MIKRIIIKGFSKKFKGVQKLPAQKSPKFKPDPGEAATKEFTKKFGEKPQFMGFSERASTSMAAESLAMKTAEKKFFKILPKELGRSRARTATGIKEIRQTKKVPKIKIFRAKQKGAMKAYTTATKKSDTVFERTVQKFSGQQKASPFKTTTKRAVKKFVSKDQKKTWGF